MEIAAAGISVIMIGPPGCQNNAGKTAILHSSLTLHEVLDTTKIHSVAGKLAADRA